MDESKRSFLTPGPIDEFDPNADPERDLLLQGSTGQSYLFVNGVEVTGNAEKVLSRSMVYDDPDQIMTKMDKSMMGMHSTHIEDDPLSKSKKLRFDPVTVDCRLEHDLRDFLIKRLGLDLDKDMERQVSEEEFDQAATFLCAEGKEPDMRNTLDNIYEKLRHQEHGLYPLWKQLIQGIINHRAMVASRAKGFRKELETIKRQQDSCRSELQLLAATPATQPEEERNRLVIQAQDVIFASLDHSNQYDEGRLLFYVRFTCEDSTAESDVMAKSPTIDSVLCNEIFHFTIEKPAGTVLIELLDARKFDVNPEAKREVLAYGQCELNLLAGMERTPIDVRVQGRVFDATVRTFMQWTQSKRDFYELSMRRLETRERTMVIAAEMQETELEKLDKTICGRSASPLGFTTPSPVKVVTTAVMNPSGFVDWGVDQIMQYRKSNDFPSVFQFVATFLVAMSFMASFTRYDSENDPVAMIDLESFTLTLCADCTYAGVIWMLAIGGQKKRIWPV